MRTSIATVCLSGDLDEKLKAIADASFEGVEIFENDLLSFDGGTRDVGRMIVDIGLHCTTFQPFRDFEGLPPELRERAFARAERKFDLMEELGAELLLVCSNVSPASLGGIDRAAADFHELGERAARRGLRVGFEALAWGRHINDHRDAWEVVRRADHPNVGLILDTFHTLSRKLPVDSIRSIPGDRIFLVQVADAPLLVMDFLSWSRHFRNFPGQGDLPLVDFMKALGATGYDGVYSLEVFNDQFRAGSPRRTAIDGQRSLIYLADASGSGKPLPPKAACSGVEFIEFSVDEQTAQELQRFLSALGFHKAGRHRSKTVHLMRQGDINLVINCDKEGFAHTYSIVHGPSVCAIGLKVADVATAMERARSLLVQSFSQPVGPGEIELPAIRGVGGSLIYLLDSKGKLGRVWETEFKLSESGHDEAAVGLTSIDHVAQSMPYEEMLSWLLTYRALFDFEKTPQVDIADPGGLVQSQVVESRDRTLRITLNSSQSPKTQSARFVNEFFGSGVQHIAFLSSDIFATVKTMETSGVAMLAIPENYYDDLEARLDLSAGLVEELRAHNLLYDRDGQGEYFQVYTRTFADRFFFEIVERRGYDGFGAMNAPIRLAAQTRSARPSAVPRR